MNKFNYNFKVQLRSRTIHKTLEQVNKDRKIFYLIDKDVSYGRLLSVMSSILQGKINQPCFSLHNTMGDYVVISNLNDSIKFTGKKEKNKVWERYTGFHGGLKTDKMNKNSFLNVYGLLRRSMRGMLPKNKQLKVRLNRILCLNEPLEINKDNLINILGINFIQIETKHLLRQNINKGKINI